MGEAKRRRRSTGLPPKQPIEAAWQSYQTMVLPPEAPDIQRQECRLAFWAGAAQLFYAIMQHGLDEGEEPTDADLQRMDNISKEIDGFARTFDAEVARRASAPTAAEEFAAMPPEGRLGDAPVEADQHHKMTAVVKGINRIFNGEKHGADRDIGFVLMVFPFGDRSGRCNYMSNGADRRDIVVLMKEMIARFEGQPETRGSA